MPKKSSKKTKDRPIIHLDIDDAEMLKSLNVGDEVTATIKGEIKEISLPRTDEDTSDGFTFPGSIIIQADKITAAGKNVFDELSSDDDD